MLQLKNCCERCGKALAPDVTGAVICSFECTFCCQCNDDTLHQVCPNCGGDLQPRPSRPTQLLEKYPPADGAG